MLLDELVRVLLGPSVRRIAAITEQQAAAVRATIEATAVVVPGVFWRRRQCETADARVMSRTTVTGG
jgi:hypothetical protein